MRSMQQAFDRVRCAVHTGRWSRAVGSVPVAAVLLATAGCYTYVPLHADAPAPVAGETIALEISDRGRVGLAERFGSGLTRIEGRVRSASPTAYDLAVFKVEYLKDASRWSGEPVQINRDFVGAVQGRQFSRSRTVVAASVAGGALLALIATRALVSSGREKDDDGNPGPDPDQSRLLRLQFSFR